MPSRLEAVAAQIRAARGLVRSGLASGNGATIESAVTELDLALSMLHAATEPPVVPGALDLTPDQKKRLRAFFDEVIR